MAKGHSAADGQRAASARSRTGSDVLILLSLLHLLFLIGVEPLWAGDFEPSIQSDRCEAYLQSYLLKRQVSKRALIRGQLSSIAQAEGPPKKITDWKYYNAWLVDQNEPTKQLGRILWKVHKEDPSVVYISEYFVHESAQQSAVSHQMIARAFDWTARQTGVRVRVVIAELSGDNSEIFWEALPEIPDTKSYTPRQLLAAADGSPLGRVYQTLGFENGAARLIEDDGAAWPRLVYSIHPLAEQELQEWFDAY